MSKNSATYAKAEERLGDIIKIAEDLGTDWRPLDPNLTLANLIVRKNGIQTFHDACNTAAAFDKIKTDERALAYLPLNPLVVRVLAMARRCQMSQAIIDQVQVYKELIDGTNVTIRAARRKKKAEKEKQKTAIGDPEPDTTKPRSVSQQAFDDRLKNFKLMIVLLTTAGTYQTNVKDLSIEALAAFAVTLKTANDATDAADAVLSTKNDERAAYIRSKTDSVGSLIKDVKEELLTIEGKAGDNYKKAVAVKFMPLRE
jgi:hypothetical protein